MSWQPDAPNPCVPERLQDVCRLYVTYSFANTCRARCPYCFADPSYKGFPRTWANEQALAAWRNVAAQYGPCFLLLSGLEPLDELPFVADLLQYHYAQVCTNLMADPAEIIWHIDPERLEIHPSLHPHLWHRPACEDFFEKVEMLQAAGFRIPLIALVGWPEWLPLWDGLVARIEGLGIMPNPVPARMTTRPDGRPLPDSYTEEELAILRRHCNPDLFTEQGAVPQLQIEACAAGVATVGIVGSGEVRRCSQLPDSMGGQNLYRDGGFDLLDAPQPCPASQCLCNNLYPYHVTEAPA